MFPDIDIKPIREEYDRLVTQSQRLMVEWKRIKFDTRRDDL